jgi:hypothetical protein
VPNFVYARFTGPVHMFFPHLPNAHGASLEADPGVIYALDHMPNSIWFTEVTEQDFANQENKAMAEVMAKADPPVAPAAAPEAPRPTPFGIPRPAPAPAQ